MKEPGTFEIKSYSWLELARLYSPEVSPSSATRRLGRWIALHPPLQKQLTRAGWRKGSRLLTPRHVRILIMHLGEP